MWQPTIAVYDTNVLYPAPLRDLLIRLAQAGLVQAKWTEMIHDEWTRNLLSNHSGITPEQVSRTRDLMNLAIRDSLVTGHEPLIETLQLPDPDDRHVLAAAIKAGAQCIVTFNLKDFPAEYLARYGVIATHPDHFLMQLIEQMPNAVCNALKLQRAGLKNPPQTASQLLQTLFNQGLEQSITRLRNHADQI